VFAAHLLHQKLVPWLMLSSQPCTDPSLQAHLVPTLSIAYLTVVTTFPSGQLQLDSDVATAAEIVASLGHGVHSPLLEPHPLSALKYFPALLQG
jgi:hypothetical protein